MTAALRVEQATLGRGGCAVLPRVAAQFQPGTLTAVVGPNGAGKTTLLRALCGLEAPLAGSVMLQDKPVAAWTVAQRARMVASLGQDEHPDPALTALEVTLLGRAPLLGSWGLPSPQDVTLAQDALRAMDVEKLAARPLHTLSGGERQRVLVARVLCQGAPVMVLDEPVEALDLAHARGVMSWLRQRASAGDTVVVAVHDLALAARFATHWVVLAPGEMLVAGPLERDALNTWLPRAFGVPLSVEDVRGTPVVVAP